MNTHTHCSHVTHSQTHTQSRVWKLSEANEELPELKKRMKSLEEERRELKDKLEELEKSSQQEREGHQKMVEEMRQNQEEATTVRTCEVHIHMHACMYFYKFAKCIHVVYVRLSYLTVKTLPTNEVLCTLYSVCPKK